MTLLEAFAKQEGFFSEGSRPHRNNNPGDLEYNAETIKFGALRGDPRFAIFPSTNIGWVALSRWLSVPARFNDKGNLEAGYLGATLKQVVFRFCPPGGTDNNNTQRYLDNVCEWSGLSPDSVVTREMIEAATE